MNLVIISFLALGWDPVPVATRVDINQGNGRSDILAAGWVPWNIRVGQPMELGHGGLRFTLACPGNTEAFFWKPGANPRARMVSDGIASKGPIRLTIAGLGAGEHTLSTFHNWTGEGAAPRVSGRVLQPGGTSEAVVASWRAEHDHDAASLFFRFTVKEGATAAVEFSADAGPVVLNGFELGSNDPALRAARPYPLDGDMHAPEDPALRWSAKGSSRRSRVFAGTDPGKLEVVGETTGTSFPTTALGIKPGEVWHWRVDSIREAGVTRGEPWRFQVRHKAFPDAEGHGQFATGGRGGRVIEVINLNDSGPGSLRQAVEAEGPRTVLFRVGGLIELKSKLVVRHPHLTVAGQTAPGDGICLKNHTFGCSDTHDVIIRHMRIRVGDESGETQDGSGARGCDHVIFDHCSISWSIDEGFSSRQAENLTVQRCLIGEALNLADHKKYRGTGKGHSFAGSISGDIGSFHHNLLVHCAGRNWSLAGGLDRGGRALAGRLDIRNNIIFNWAHRTTDGGVLDLEYVGNLYLPGPASSVFTLLKPDPGDWDRGMRAHMEGNVIEGRVTGDNWAAASGPAAGLAIIRQGAPLLDPMVETHQVADLPGEILPDVGATRPRRDAVDQRLVADVMARKHTFTGSRGGLKGIIDTPSDAGGWPRYETGPVEADSDHDGMPDTWEASHGLNPADPRDGAAPGLDGYTHLEWYLNHLASGKPSFDPKYREVIRKRAHAAVADAGIGDPGGRILARDAVERHYFGIQDIHAERDQEVRAARGDRSRVESARARAAGKVARVHAAFTAFLASKVEPGQADAIKDRMTFGTRQATYRNYLEMLPRLSEGEKEMIRRRLLEGREEALVAGDAREKHEKFNLAKGRIANALSAAGYDLKKAAAEWAARAKGNKEGIP